MTEMVAESWADAARRIRLMCPIAGQTATNEEVALRDDLIDLTLVTHGVTPGGRCWYTAQLTTGRVVGQWAQSVEEAELGISVWFGADCAWAIEDSDGRIRDEYAPRGPDVVFPLGTPRRPRDRFAPATSLLDGLEPAGTSSDLGR